MSRAFVLLLNFGCVALLDALFFSQQFYTSAPVLHRNLQKLNGRCLKEIENLQQQTRCDVILT